MSSEKKCCVPGCSRNSDSRNALHLFPNPAKDVDRFKLWLFNIGGDILAFSNEYIYKNRRVCHAHFESRFCCRNNRISNIAVPTLNLPELSKLKLPVKSTEVKRPLRAIENMINTMPSTSKATQMVACKQNMSTFIPVPNTTETEKEIVSILPENKTSSDNQDPINQSTIQMVASKQNMSTLIPVPNTTETDKEIEPILPENKTSSDNQDLINQRKGRALKKVSVLRTKLTKTELSLYKTLVKTRAKLSKYKNKAKKQSAALKSAQKLFSNEKFINALQNIPSTGRLITLMQFRESKKKDKGRRFSEEEKLVSLTIMKQSPKAYRFLRKIFILPSPQTLGTLLSQTNISAGLNKNVFSQLKARTEKMTIVERLCLLLFDEMSLKPSLAFNQRKDAVTGFVENMKEARPIFADHAQVFMVRGLVKNYKQPVAFTFSSGATSGPELANQIKIIVMELQEAGFIVVATICDQGTNNRSAIKILTNNTKREYLLRGEVPKDNVIRINDQELVPLYDPPHLLKGLRNNLLTKNLKYELNGVSKTAKWQHIEMFMHENPAYKGIRLVPKLTENHVDKRKISKMKVKYAAQVFSRTVASNMGYLADKGILLEECKDTADLLLFIDDIFDSVNGSYANKKRHSKPLLQAVTINSAHHKKWTEAKKIFKTMRFFKNDLSDDMNSVPTVENWLWTLEGIEYLLRKLKNDHNITSVWMRHLNQDPLENFFGVIRSHGYRNVNPIPDAFQSAYTALLINNISSVHAPGANCQNDYCNSLMKLISNKDCEVNKSATQIDLNKILNIKILPLEEKDKPSIMAPLQYVSGYVVNKSKKIFKNCCQCNIDLINNNEVEYIKYRDYSKKRWLCSPTQSVISLFSAFQDIITEELKENLEKKNIAQYIKTILYTVLEFDCFKCDKHKEKLKDYIINLSIKFFIYNYCKTLNKILTGVQEIIDDTDKYQIMAKNYYKRHCKRPHNR